jgi:hypothetical protein
MRISHSDMYTLRIAGDSVAQLYSTAMSRGGSTPNSSTTPGHASVSELADALVCTGKPSSSGLGDDINERAIAGVRLHEKPKGITTDGEQHRKRDAPAMRHRLSPLLNGVRKAGEKKG